MSRFWRSAQNARTRFFPSENRAKGIMCLLRLNLLVESGQRGGRPCRWIKVTKFSLNVDVLGKLQAKYKCNISSHSKWENLVWYGDEMGNLFKLSSISPISLGNPPPLQFNFSRQKSGCPKKSLVKLKLWCYFSRKGVASKSFSRLPLAALSLHLEASGHGGEFHLPW